MNFYQLQPYGVGTEAMESLPSYLIRMANAHGRSVEKLVKRMIDNQPGITAENRHHFYRTLIASELDFVVRPTTYTRQLVTVIERSCSVTGLRGATFLCLEKCSLRTSVSCFSEHIRWCPGCFLDDRSQLQNPYLRLLWSVQAITQCLEHQQSLESRCPHCENTQSSWARDCPIDVCLHCGLSLCCSSDRDDECSGDEIRQHTVIGPLIKTISSSPQLTFADKATSAFISWIGDQPYGQRKLEERDERGQSLVPNRYVKKHGPIPLSICVSISARLNIGLDIYLGCNTLEWSRAIFPNEPWSIPVLPVGYDPVTSLTPRDLTTRINRLRDESDNQQAMSLSRIAASLDIEANDIVYLVPKLAQEIQCAHVTQGIQRKEYENTCKAVERYRRLGRESSRNPRVQVTALLERDFPDMTLTMIESLVDEAMSEIFMRVSPYPKSVLV